MSWVARLVRDLVAGEGLTATATGDDEYLLVVPHDDGSATSVRLVVAEAKLERLLRRMSPDGHYLFPDVPPTEGAYRLLRVHFRETLETRPGAELIRVTRRGLEVRPDTPRPPVLPLPADGGSYWTHERPPADVDVDPPDQEPPGTA